jgi:two-component system, chemotaxis family, response regulator PixG
MSQDFQPLQLLKDLSKDNETGHLQIEANSVTWNLYLVAGKLLYASHSLQLTDTIEHYLLCLGYGNAAKNVPVLAQDIQGDRQLIPFVAQQLLDRDYLNASQKTVLLTELSRDALESFLWLAEGESHWNSLNPLQALNGAIAVRENLLELPPLLELLQVRLQTWQKLSPSIASPHQRPLCVNPSLLRQPVPLGKLSPDVLEKLSKLMRGSTIRQLSLFLKQDEMKVAQLLLLYIKHKIFQLLPPKSPLDRLPTIPQFQPNSQLSTPAPTPTFVTPSQTAPLARTNQKIHKIVCIDDSPTMLDTIKTYLGTEKYEIITIENPMKSMPSLFESKPDLILMDISMPGINGNRLCQILKSSSVFEHVPIILVSGNTKILTQETIQSVGATDYLAKPFSSESLRVMVETYLKSAN